MGGSDALTGLGGLVWLVAAAACVSVIILGDLEEPGTAPWIAAVFGTSTNRENQAIAISAPSLDPAGD